MSDEAKRIVAEETWTADGISVHGGYPATNGNELGYFPYAHAGDDVARIAACAPEALRMLLDIQNFEGGLCLWCRHPSCGDEHDPDCEWLALMRKAGVRE